MPEVIADTSVLQYLYQADHFSLLPALYRKIKIPIAVREELQQGLDMNLSLPNVQEFHWIEIVDLQENVLLPQIPGLGRGEREVLSLAGNISDSLALLDDGLARRYANQLKVRFTGTLGVLLKAKQSGLSTLEKIS